MQRNSTNRNDPDLGEDRYNLMSNSKGFKAGKKHKTNVLRHEEAGNYKGRVALAGKVTSARNIDLRQREQLLKTSLQLLKHRIDVNHTSPDKSRTCNYSVSLQPADRVDTMVTRSSPRGHSGVTGMFSPLGNLSLRCISKQQVLEVKQLETLIDEVEIKLV